MTLTAKKYFVFALEHRTKEEGSRKKVHIVNEHGFLLCGHVSKMGSETGQESTLKWVNYPDPDEQLCKNCKKIFLKLNP